MSEMSEEMEHGAASSEEEQDDDQDNAPPVQSLVEGRQKRVTAGRRMTALINQEVEAEGDQEDELTLLFAGPEEEDEDFMVLDVAEASNAPLAVEDDEDDDSSSEESEHEGDELAGEKQLDKEERVARRAEKRKANKAFGRAPAPRKKKVRIVEDTVKASPTQIASSPQDSNDTSERSKRSERVSWLPLTQEAPTRSSSRTLSVQNKEKIIASMKESEGRRVRQIAVMEAAQKRKGSEKARPLTQAEKMAEAVRTEKINKKSLGKWEQMELERQEKQRLKLEALHNRTLAGPVISWYSGPAQWVNGKLTHVGKPTKIEEVEQPTLPDAPIEEEAQVVTPAETMEKDVTEQALAESPNPVRDENKTIAIAPTATELDHSVPSIRSTEQQLQRMSTSSENFLDGIHLYASLPETACTTDSPQVTSPMPSPAAANDDEAYAPASVPAEEVSKSNPLDEVPTEALQPPRNIEEATNPIASEATAPVFSTPITDSTEPPITTTATPPPTIELSTRNLLHLQNYPSSALASRDILRRITFGTFSPKPIKPTQHLCAITNAPARYRDPATGLPYAGLDAYRKIRRLVSGGCTWSNLLGAWVGQPDVGGVGAEVWRPRAAAPAMGPGEGVGGVGASAAVKQESGQVGAGGVAV